MLGVERLAMEFGGVMGGQPGFQWGVRFPDQVERIAALAGTAAAGEQALIPGSERREIQDVHGHAAIFGPWPDCAPQVDTAPGDLLGSSV